MLCTIAPRGGAELTGRDRHRPALARLLLPLLLAVSAACAPDPAPRLEVAYAGCAEVSNGPVCQLAEDHRLRLWVAAPCTAPLTVMTDGTTLAVEPRPVRDGMLLEVRVPDGATRLELTVKTPAKASWQLRLQPATGPPPWHRQARALCLEQQDFDAARRLLHDRLAEDLPPAAAGAAHSLLGQIALHLGEADQARQQLAAAVACRRQAHQLLGETSDATVLALLLIEQHDLVAARQALDQLPCSPSLPAEARYYAAYYQGLLAEATGDARSALQYLRAAALLAERLGLAREQQLAELVLARQLQALGRNQEAAALFSRLRQDGADGLPACDQAHLLNNQAWALLLAGEAGHRGADPTPLLEQARALFASGSCRQTETELVNVHLNLALAHLQRGRLHEARQCLATARSMTEQPPLQQVLWWLEINGRIALATGRPGQALVVYQRLQDLAAMSLVPQAAWRAAVGRARALRHLGRIDEALATFARAEALAAQESLQVPLQEGRETFVAASENGTREHLDLLLEQGRVAPAMTVARRARARILRGLHSHERLGRLSASEQEQWDRLVAEYRAGRAALEASLASGWEQPADRLAGRQRQLDELRSSLAVTLDQALALLQAEAGAGQPGKPPRPAGDAVAGQWQACPPGPGELLLLYHPLPSGWVGFAATASSVHAVRIAAVEPALADPAQLAGLLLAPFAAEIETAQGIRFLPYGPLRQVDLHALPFAGDILLATRTVVYGLDLAARPALPPEIRTVLLVADPTNDLPRTRTEAAAVREALARRQSPPQVQLLQGDAATGAAVRAGLTRVDLFHYSGHGRFGEDRGWSSALTLAGGCELTIGDLLLLDRVPALAVLSGCETGRSTRQAAVESIALSHALLARGAAQVIATSRPVTDTTAAQVIAALYQGSITGWNGATLLRRAQLQVRQQHPEADWAAYRLLEP